MSILMRCMCGKQFRLSDDLVGRRVKCPECGEISTVAKSDEDVRSSQAVSKARPAAPRPRHEAVDDGDYEEEPDERPRRRRPREEEDYEEEERPRRRRREEDDDDEDEERPRRGDRSRRRRRGSNSGRLSRRDIYSVAVYQKVLLLCILGYIVFAILSRVVPEPVLKVVFLLLALGVGVVATVFVFMLALKVYSVGAGIVLAILTLIPLVGLIVLLIINAKATGILKKRGYSVGLLGASLSELRD